MKTVTAQVKTAHAFEDDPAKDEIVFSESVRLLVNLCESEGWEPIGTLGLGGHYRDDEKHHHFVTLQLENA